MLITRRDFLKVGSLATTSLLLPKFLKAVEAPGALAMKGRSLVVIQFSGGNDGLNTIIPTRNDVYYRERPGLGIKRETALALTDEAGLHPTLTGLKNLWDAGHMAVLNSVGYPNPDRSHFRSMDIWQSASPADEYWQTGWLGRYLDAQCAGRPAAALEFDDTLSLVMKGENSKGLALQDAKRLYESTRSPFFAEYSAAKGKVLDDDAPVDYLYKTMAETLSSANYLFEQSRKANAGRAGAGLYPVTGLGKDLKTIASLILADTDTAVYYVSLGSFDTHINQEAQQKRLFQELNDALAAFSSDLKANGKWNEVLVATFSEFGRRVSQNASGGTDHGTANNMMFLGGGLRQKGLLNPMPNLLDLDQGDLKYQVDFRQVYATLLENWLGADAGKVLGGEFAAMGFV
ncbi:MAG: DUF1501 domain-containing protein [Phycisphaerae bacterium]|nr:DUF1501 domain-containing protein [Saprospiraceae bacterium]